MSYKINTTDGTLLVDLIDGRIDVDTTDLTLIGRNYTGYGEQFNENFIKVLENFANSSAPANPIRGQLWYDTSEARLKIFDGDTFKATNATVVSAGIPPSLVAGELWVDTANKQLKFSDGENIYLAGPIYTAAQGLSGFDIQTVLDQFGNPKVIARIMIGAQAVAIISREAFTVASGIQDFGTTIEQGINISDVYTNFVYHGTASSANLLGGISSTGFLRTNPAGGGNTTEGFLHVKDDRGVIIGDNFDFNIRIDGSTSVLRNQTGLSDVKFQINQGTTNVPVYVDYLTVDNSTNRIGIFQNTPAYTLDVTGDLRITGDLLVEGDATYVDVASLRVEVKNIELAITSDSTLLDESLLDGAGIIVRATGDDKTLTWTLATDSWTSSTNFDMLGTWYKVGGTNILSLNTLGPTVTTAAGLTTIGTLGNLDVDNINLNGATITTTSGLIITSSADIQVTNSRKITGVGTPDVSDDPSHVATKGYVDEKILDEDIFLSLDITGLSDAQIASVLDDLVPAVAKNTGVYARVHCTAYTGQLTYNAADGISKSFVSVDKAGTENQSVLADIGFANTIETVTMSVTRSLKRFIVNGANQWAFESNLVSSV
jgi:hypothetical protein